MFNSFTGKRRVYLWIAIVGSVLTVLSLVFALVIVPLIIDSIVGNYLILKNGTEAWDRFEELPFPMDFNVYFFEVTNSEDVVENGSLPDLNEIGPFVYKNYRKKYDIRREDDEHVSYYQNQIFEFDAERTGAHLSLQKNFTTLNFLIIGLFQIIENSRATLPFSVEEVLPFVIEETGLFNDVNVEKFLFGKTYFCNPDRTNFQAKFVCLIVMLLNLKMITYEPDLSMHYSLFAFKNNTHDGRFVVNTGEKDIMKLGQVKSLNGEEYTSFWKGENSECNKVEGLDVTLFPPYLEENTDFKVYSTDVCRTITMKFLEKSEFRDLEVYEYGLKDDMFRPKENECADESCFCSDYTRGLTGEKECFLDGVQDVYPCLGIPGLVSFPHFLYADSKYSDTVNNLSPNESMHASTMKIQPFTGVPMEGFIAIQISLIARRIELSGKVMDVTANLSNFSLPILWLQQGVTITDEYYDMIDEAVTLILIADITKWVLVLVAGLLCMVPASMLILS